VETLAAVLVLLFMIAALATMGYCSVSRQREHSQVERMRTTDMYKRLYRQMTQLNNHAVDQIIIESSGVTVTSVYPAHTLLSFGFKQNGNACRNCDTARLVAHSLASDFSILGDADTYKLSRYRIYRLNGRKEYGYAYTMRRACKDRIFEYHDSRQLRIY
jgi:hypothetical protein